MNVKLHDRNDFGVTRRDQKAALLTAISRAIALGAVPVYRAYEFVPWEPNNEIGVYATPEAARKAVVEHIAAARKNGEVYKDEHACYVEIIVLNQPKLRTDSVRFSYGKGRRVRKEIVEE